MRIRALFLPLLALSVLAFLPDASKACIGRSSPPPAPTIVSLGANRYQVIVVSYTTFASSAGSQFCACALAHDGLVLVSVDSAVIIDPSNGQALGFGFSQDAGISSAFNGIQPSTWQGFSGTSPGTAGGQIVDLVFTVTAKPNSSPSDIAGALRFVGTDEASSAGTLLGTHRGIFALSSGGGGSAPLFSSWGLIAFALSLMGLLIWKERARTPQTVAGSF